MSAIFVSYRREDSQSLVGRLIDRLELAFGKDQIFRDLSSISYGQDFSDAINRALDACEVLLVVIGNDWTSIADDSGRRRLDDPDDWVRIEVAKALAKDIPVIPLLVEDAPMPSAEQLPDDLRPLVRRSAAKLRVDPDFDNDIDRLLGAINDYVKMPASDSVWSKRSTLAGLIIAAALVAAFFVFDDWQPLVSNDSEQKLDAVQPQSSPTKPLVYAKNAPAEFAHELVRRFNPVFEKQNRYISGQTVFDNTGERIFELKNSGSDTDDIAGLVYVPETASNLMYDAYLNNGNVRDVLEGLLSDRWTDCHLHWNACMTELSTISKVSLEVGPVDVSGTTASMNDDPLSFEIVAEEQFMGRPVKIEFDAAFIESLYGLAPADRGLRILEQGQAAVIDAL